MASEILEPPRDANGVKILPGYRPPFNSETARIHGIKGARAMQRKALLRKLGPDGNVLLQVLREVKTLLERSKRGSRVVLQKSTDGQTTASISPTISPRPVKKNAPAVKPGGVNPAVSPVVSPKPTIAPPGQPTSQAAQEPDDDCLF